MRTDGSPATGRRHTPWLLAPALALATLLGLPACNDTGELPPDGSTDVGEVPPGRDPEIEDTSQAGLAAFAKSGEYLKWLAEAEVHPSAGPHGGRVRTFFNDLIAASLAAGQTPHPRGSILVKELWGSGESVEGYAINVKVGDGEGPDTWLFWEAYGPDFEGFYGVANGTCTGCHSQGKDYVRTANLP